MRVIAIVLLALSPAALWKQVTRETNSHAAAERGAQQYATSRFDDAERSFSTAQSIAPNPKTAFNLGTSQIAAGHRPEGSATLGKAMADPALRPQALYNRGNSALASKAYDHAVSDYSEALRLRPNDGDAKRNLEIAMQQRDQEEEERQRRRRQQQQGGQQPQPQQPPQPGPGAKKDEKRGDADAEALLRSVQQQEQEELARMKRTRWDSRSVGW